MAKTFKIEGLIDPEATPKPGPVKQRGSGQGAKRPQEKPAPVMMPSKRLSLVLDGETYQDLRRMAFETGRTHQDILDEAARAYLRKHASTHKDR